MATYREKIMDALGEVLNNRNVPHTGVGTKNMKGKLAGVVYLDHPVEDFTPDVKAKVPERIDVTWGRRRIPVKVAFENIGSIQPG